MIQNTADLSKTADIFSTKICACVYGTGNRH